MNNFCEFLKNFKFQKLISKQLKLNYLNYQKFGTGNSQEFFIRTFLIFMIINLFSRNIFLHDLQFIGKKLNGNIKKA